MSGLRIVVVKSEDTPHLLFAAAPRSMADDILEDQIQGAVWQMGDGANWDEALEANGLTPVEVFESEVTF